jgi:hypothetical protein
MKRKMNDREYFLVLYSLLAAMLILAAASALVQLS